MDSFQTFSGSVAIYFNHTTVDAPEGRPTRLRLIARQIERRVGEPDSIAWTDSDRCRALLDLARDFQALDAPRTVLPGQTWPPEPPMQVMDGVTWTLWSRIAQQAGRYPASFQMSSNSGRIADWGTTAHRTLKGCWGDDQPPGPI